MIVAAAQIIWFRRAAFLLVAFAIILVYMLPVGMFRQPLPLPAFIYCSVICVVIRQPESVPYWLIALVLLAGDTFHMRPLGLWTLIVVCVAEVFRNSRLVFMGQVFAFEWLAAVLGFLCALVAQQVAMFLLLVPAPTFRQLLWLLLTTGIAYPVAVMLWSGLLGYRRRRATSDFTGAEA